MRKICKARMVQIATENINVAHAIDCPLLENLSKAFERDPPLMLLSQKPTGYRRCKSKTRREEDKRFYGSPKSNDPLRHSPS